MTDDDVDERIVRNINQSADSVRLSTKVVRGTGTRDQETIKVKVRGDDPTETVQELNEALDELEATAETVRGIQPDDS